MKEYAFYIWAAYGICFALLLGQLVQALQKSRKIKHEISAQDE